MYIREEDNDDPRWAVLTHLNPKWIYAMLEKEQHDALLPSFSFWIPYFDLLTVAGHDLRDDFRTYVFVKASRWRLGSILYADWNTNTRLRLCHCRDREGREMMIRESELKRLGAIFRQQNLEFFLGTPVRAFDGAEGCKVKIRMPYWDNKVGVVRQVRVRHAKGTASMRVAFLIDGLEHEITFPELHDSDVDFIDEHDRVLLTGKVIENFEREVALLLGHCYIPKRHATEDELRAAQAKRQREDAPRLRRIMGFADIEMGDDDDRRRFTALLLMCSVMLGDKTATQRYQSMVEGWLGPLKNVSATAVTPLRTPTEAYLTVALFVATRHPLLRTSLKAFRTTHPDCPPIISRLINKVRDIKTQK